MIDLSGSVALIPGASGGMGREVARMFAEHGCDVGRDGVTANIVCPGPTEGPALDKLRSQGTTGSRIVEELTKRVPMKRLGTARDIATGMLFLASKEAGYITGQALSVSGGLVMN